jgi:hypothetical protein
VASECPSVRIVKGAAAGEQKQKWDYYKLDSGALGCFHHFSPYYPADNAYCSVSAT